MASTIISTLAALSPPGHVRLHRQNQPGVHDRRGHAQRSDARPGQCENHTQRTHRPAKAPRQLARNHAENKWQTGPMRRRSDFYTPGGYILPSNSFVINKSTLKSSTNLVEFRRYCGPNRRFFGPSSSVSFSHPLARRSKRKAGGLVSHPAQVGEPLRANSVRQTIQREIQVEDIHARLADKTERPPLDVLIDQAPNSRLSQAARLGDTRNLIVGIVGRDVGIEAGGGSSHHIDGHGLALVLRGQLVDIALNARDGSLAFDWARFVPPEDVAS